MGPSPVSISVPSKNQSQPENGPVGLRLQEHLQGLGSKVGAGVPCWRLGPPPDSSRMAPRGAEDTMLLCPEVTKQSGEGCWSLPANPTHPPPCSVSAGRPLRTEALRIPGFQLHSAYRGHQDEIRGQQERDWCMCSPLPASTTRLALQAPVPLAQGAANSSHSEALGAAPAPSGPFTLPTPLRAVPTLKSLSPWSS